MSLDETLQISLEKKRNGNVDTFTFRVGERIVPTAFVSINGGNLPKDPDALPMLLDVLCQRAHDLSKEYSINLPVRYGDSTFDDSNLNGVTFDYSHAAHFDNISQVRNYLDRAGITDRNPLIDGLRLERRDLA